MILPLYQSFPTEWTLLENLYLKFFLIGKERYVRINNTKKSTPKYIGHVQWAPNGRPQKSAQIPEDTQEDPSHSPKSN